VTCDAEIMTLSSQTSIFAAGVGLGASKGVEIGKHPEGYAGYLSKGRDVVRIYSSYQVVDIADSLIGSRSL
jgi:hypothetical protein